MKVVSYTYCPHVTVPTTATSDGCTVALVVTLPLAAIVIVALMTILVIIAKQLKDARYTVILEPSSACCVTPPVCTDHVLSALQDSTWKTL